MRPMHRSFRVLVDQDDDGTVTVTVPDLPGCIAYGDTHDEALENVKEAIESYMESLQRHNEPVSPSIHEEIVTVELDA